MEEIKAIDIARQFSILFNRISMYIPSHPSFTKAIDDFYRFLLSLKPQATVIDLYPSPQAVIINGQETKDRPNVPLGFYLHRRSVGRLTIDLEGLRRDEVTKLALALSQPPQKIVAEGGLEKILARENCQKIQAKNIDYQKFMQEEGEEIDSFWDFVRQKIQAGEKKYKAKDIFSPQARKNWQKELAALSKEDFLLLLEHLKEYSQKVPVSPRHLNQAVLSAYCQNPNLQEEEKIAAKINFKPEDLEDAFSSLAADSQVDSLQLLRRLAFLTKNNSNFAFSSKSQNAFEQLDQSRQKELKAAAQQLLKSKTLRNFLSPSYRKFLESIVQQAKNIEKKNELTVAQKDISANYFFMLLDILHLKAQISIKIAEILKGEFGRALKTKNKVYLFSLLKVVKENKSKAKNCGILNLLSYICSESRQHFYEILELAKDKEGISLALDIIVNMEDKDSFLWDKLKSKPELIYQDGFKQILCASSAAAVKSHIKKLFVNKTNPLLLKEYLQFLNLLPLEKSQDCLVEICSLSENNTFLLAKALEILQKKGFSQPGFFEPFILHMDAACRESALLAILAHNWQKAQFYLDKLLLPISLFGLRDKFVQENIEIAERNDLRLSRPFLQKIIRRPWFLATKETKAKAQRALLRLQQNRFYGKSV